MSEMIEETKDSKQTIDTTKEKQDEKKTVKKPSLTPYQAYLAQMAGERNKTNYYGFYNDIKHPTHQIYDW